MAEVRRVSPVGMVPEEAVEAEAEPRNTGIAQIELDLEKYH